MKFWRKKVFWNTSSLAIKEHLKKQDVTGLGKGTVNMLTEDGEKWTVFLWALQYRHIPEKKLRLQFRSFIGKFDHKHRTPNKSSFIHSREQEDRVNSKINLRWESIFISPEFIVIFQPKKTKCRTLLKNFIFKFLFFLKSIIFSTTTHNEHHTRGTVLSVLALLEPSARSLPQEEGSTWECSRKASRLTEARGSKPL